MLCSFEAARSHGDTESAARVKNLELIVAFGVAGAVVLLLGPTGVAGLVGMILY